MALASQYMHRFIAALLLVLIVACLQFVTESYCTSAVYGAVNAAIVTVWFLLKTTAA